MLHAPCFPDRGMRAGETLLLLAMFGNVGNAALVIGGLEMTVASTEMDNDRTSLEAFEKDPNAQHGVLEGIAAMGDVPVSNVSMTVTLNRTSSIISIGFVFSVAEALTTFVEPTAADNDTVNTSLGNVSNATSSNASISVSSNAGDHAKNVLVSHPLETLKATLLALSLEVAADWISKGLGRRVGSGLYVVSVRRLWISAIETLSGTLAMDWTAPSIPTELRYQTVGSGAALISSLGGCTAVVLTSVSLML